MDSKNETCIQRSRFFLYFFEEGEWKKGGKSPFEDFTKSNEARPDQIRALRDYVARRLERIADMVELLMKVHSDWAVTAKKDHVLLETETFDFNDTIKLLKDRGFSDDEYILKVEYTRKWGVL